MTERRKKIQVWTNPRKNFWWLNQSIKWVRLPDRDGVHCLGFRGAVLASISDEALKLPYESFKNFFEENIKHRIYDF